MIYLRLNDAGELETYDTNSATVTFTVDGQQVRSRPFNAADTAWASGVAGQTAAAATQAQAIADLAAGKTATSQSTSLGRWVVRPGATTSGIGNAALVRAVIEGFSGSADEQWPVEFMIFSDGDTAADNLSLQIWGPVKKSANGGRWNIQAFARKGGSGSGIFIGADFVYVNGKSVEPAAIRVKCGGDNTLTANNFTSFANFTTDYTQGPSGSYSISNGTVTVNQAGLYSMHLQVTASAGSATGEARLTDDAGSTVYCRQPWPANNMVASCSDLRYLTAGSTVKAAFFAAGGVTINADAAGVPCGFTITRIPAS